MFVYSFEVSKEGMKETRNELLLQRQHHNTFDIHAFQKVQVQISMLRLQKCWEKSKRDSLKPSPHLYRPRKSVPDLAKQRLPTDSSINLKSINFPSAKITSEIIICRASFQFPISNIFVTGPRLTNMLR